MSITYILCLFNNFVVLFLLIDLILKHLHVCLVPGERQLGRCQ